MDTLRSWRLTAVALAFVFALGACGGTTPSTAPASAGPVATAAPSTAPSAPSGEGQTLVVWGPPDFSPEMKSTLDAYAAKIGATLDVTNFPDPFEQNLLARWAAGDRPDILFFHGAGNWLVQLNPEENLIAMTGQPFIGRTVPDLLEATTTFRGVTYGAIVKSPFGYGAYYNKKAFADAGLTEPTSGGYQSLVDLCTGLKAKAPDVAPIFIGGGDQWPTQPLIVGLWGDDVTPDVARLLNTAELKFTDPKFVDWIGKEKELKDQGCLNDDVLTATYDDEQASLFDGRAAMVYQGSWFYDGLVEAQGSDKVEAEIGWFPLSGKGQTVSWEIPADGTMYAPKTGDATKEALATGFLDYITSEGYDAFRSASNDYPVIEGFDPPADAPPLRTEIYAQYLKTGSPIFQQVIAASYGPMETFFQEVLAGTKTPLEAGEALQAEFERSAKQVGLPGY